MIVLNTYLMVEQEAQMVIGLFRMLMKFKEKYIWLFFQNVWSESEDMI